MLYDWAFRCDVFQRHSSLLYLCARIPTRPFAMLTSTQTYDEEEIYGGEVVGDSDGGTNPARALLSLHPQHASLGGITRSR